MTAKKSTKKAAKKASVKRKKIAEVKPLPLRQEKFIQNYVENGGNGKKAAEDAGYAPGHGAETEASRLLRNAKIRERIEARLLDSEIDTREILGTLAAHMRADIADVVPNNPVAKAAKAAGVSHLIKKVTIKRYWDKGKNAEVEETVVEIHNSQSAAQILGKYRGLEKLPDENPQQAERQKEKYERAVQAFIEAKTRRGQKCTRESAITALSKIEPEISNYVN